MQNILHLRFGRNLDISSKQLAKSLGPIPAFQCGGEAKYMVAHVESIGINPYVGKNL